MGTDRKEVEGEGVCPPDSMKNSPNDVVKSRSGFPRDNYYYDLVVYLSDRSRLVLHTSGRKIILVCRDLTYSSMREKPSEVKEWTW